MTNRFLLKLNVSLHCPQTENGNRNVQKWEAGHVKLPAKGPFRAYPGKRQTAPQIVEGDELWIWTHESPTHGGGKGLTAKARAGQVISSENEVSVQIHDVETINQHIGYAVFPRDESNNVISGSRLIDYTHTQTEYATYIIEDEDYEEFLSLVAVRRAASEEHADSQKSEWACEIEQNKASILQDLAERRLTYRKTRPVQPMFRAALLKLYGGKCVVTGCDVHEALEAAHVLPHNGSPIRDRTDNGLLLRRDLHAMFDKGLWDITPGTNTIFLAPKLKTSTFRNLHRMKVSHHVDPEVQEIHYREFRGALRDG